MRLGITNRRLESVSCDPSVDGMLQPLAPLQRRVTYSQTGLQQVREDLPRVYSFHETREGELHGRVGHVLNNTEDGLPEPGKGGGRKQQQQQQPRNPSSRTQI